MIKFLFMFSDPVIRIIHQLLNSVCPVFSSKVAVVNGPLVDSTIKSALIHEFYSTPLIHYAFITHRHCVRYIESQPESPLTAALGA